MHKIADGKICYYALYNKAVEYDKQNKGLRNLYNTAREEDILPLSLFISLTETIKMTDTVCHFKTYSRSFIILNSVSLPSGLTFALIRNLFVTIVSSVFSTSWTAEQIMVYSYSPSPISFLSIL